MRTKEGSHLPNNNAVIHRKMARRHEKWRGVTKNIVALTI
jgi:hypothetical protein